MYHSHIAQNVADVTKNIVQNAVNAVGNKTNEMSAEMQELLQVETSDDFKHWMTNALSRLGEGFVNWVIRLGLAVLIFLIVRAILKKLITFLGERMDKRGVPESVKSIVLWLLKYGLMIYIVVQLLLFLDLVQSAAVAAAVAAMGVGISMALQGAIKNFAGGLLLLLLKPFKEGDYITVDGNPKFEGTVDRIHVYYTTLLNEYNDKVRVPNSELTDKTMINRMADGNKRLEIHVGMEYGGDVERNLDILKEIVQSDERVFEDRQVYFVHELGAHAIVLGIRCVVRREDYLNVRWDLNKKICLRFAKEGIVIPYEQLDVHIKQS